MDTATAQYSTTELLIAVIARLLEGCKHVAVGASSPIPGTAALLARRLSHSALLARRLSHSALLARRLSHPALSTSKPHADAPLRVSILNSTRNSAFTNGGVELFDLAAQGRIDAFFLGGGQIDGQGNINLVGTGTYPQVNVRWPGSFGSAYLYYLIPRVILFREEHTRRVMVPRVDFVSAPGVSDPRTYRPGGPHALLTRLALFDFDRGQQCFRLRSVHPGHTVEEIRDNTGFAFDCPAAVPTTPPPDAAWLELIRGGIRDEIAEAYPRFATSLGR